MYIVPFRHHSHPLGVTHHCHCNFYMSAAVLAQSYIRCDQALRYAAALCTDCGEALC